MTEPHELEEQLEDETERFEALAILAFLTGIGAQRPPRRPEGYHKGSFYHDGELTFECRLLDWTTHYLGALKEGNPANRGALFSMVSDACTHVLQLRSSNDPPEPELFHEEAWYFAEAFPAPERWRGLRLHSQNVVSIGETENSPPILCADAILAAIVEYLGERDGAERIRSTPIEPRWRRWSMGNEDTYGLRPAVFMVLAVAWKRILAERERAAKEAEEAKHKRPALPRAVLKDRLLPAMTRQFSLFDDGKVRSETGRPLGVIVVDGHTTLEAMRDGLALLGSVHGHRLVHKLVHRAFDAYEDGAGDPRRVAFSGGWEGLANAIGYGETDLRKLQLIVKAGQSVEWQTSHLRAGGLWTWSAKRGSRNGPGEVAFILGDALLPGLAAALADEDKDRSLSARMARRLVPELRYEPPTGAVRPNEAGMVWTLQRLVLLELVDQAEEYFKAGSIPMTKNRWRELFAQAKLPWPTYDRVLASWLEGESEDAPALLARTGPDRFDLAPVHDLERGFLTEQGRRRVEGRANGKAGRAKKRKG